MDPCFQPPALIPKAQKCQRQGLTPFPLIASVDGPNDPANLRSGLSALKIWADPKQSSLYAHTGSTATCNKYVADALAGAGFDATIRVYLFHTRIAGATEWHDINELGAFKVKWIIKGTGSAENSTEITLAQPVFGDIISYPIHVGVYLGRGLYVSSTTCNPFAGLQGNDVVIHDINQTQEKIYRSP